ncbi:hypothetical protein [Nocardia sp. NPDC048505]|uniref:hypothetical protein n=1 Tax=unclassified Nocardia TaxID=2637762 RepID=UPI0033EB53F2
MENSAELYVELLTLVEATLPEVAAEIRREVDRGGTEVELYDDTESGELPVDWAWKTDPRRYPNLPPFKTGPQPDLMARLSGDRSLHTILDALITLLEAVEGSEQELTRFLYRAGSRSVAFGAAAVRPERIAVPETAELPSNRAAVRADLRRLRDLLDGFSEDR